MVQGNAIEQKKEKSHEPNHLDCGRSRHRLGNPGIPGPALNQARDITIYRWEGHRLLFKSESLYYARHRADYVCLADELSAWLTNYISGNSRLSVRRLGRVELKYENGLTDHATILSSVSTRVYPNLPISRLLRRKVRELIARAPDPSVRCRTYFCRLMDNNKSEETEIAHM